MNMSTGNPAPLGNGGNGESSVPAVYELGSQHAMLHPGIKHSITGPPSFFNPMPSVAGNQFSTLMPPVTQQAQSSGDTSQNAQQQQQVHQQQQQQMLWQQAMQHLTCTNLAVSQAQFSQKQPPQSMLGTQDSNSYLFPGLNPAGAPIHVPPNVPVHFFQAMGAVPAAAQAVSAVSAPIVPAKPSKRRAKESSGNRNRKALKVEPSVISSYSNISSAMSVHSDDSEMKDFPLDNVDCSNMTPAQRRRHERNLREQQRSYRISQQIKGLREVLTESNIPFKPNKFSILVSIVEYIKQLQSRAVMLGSEHQKLVDTIQETNELVSSGQMQNLAESENDLVSLSDVGDSSSDQVIVRGLDYSSVFEHCPYAIGVAALDGRILSCNAAFETLIGCTKREMLQQSLFMVIRNHQELFEAMASLLKESSGASETGEGTVVKEQRPLRWSGNIVSLRSQKVSLLVFFFYP
jgi:PAS domain S-box-containing protein